MDDDEWVLRYMVVNTRNWLPGRSVLVAPKWLRGYKWEDRQVKVDLSRAAIMGSPTFDPKIPVNRQYEEHLYDYYGREQYWTNHGQS